MPDYLNMIAGFGHWIPAFAGMTVSNLPKCNSPGQLTQP